MKTVNLDATTSSVEILLGGAVATNQIQWTCHRYDTTVADGTVLEGKTTGLTNNTTAVTVCAAPASGHTRTIKEISVYNADTTSATIIVQFNDNTNLRIMCKKTLAAGSSCAISDGAIVGTGDVIGPNSATGDNIAVFDGATGKLIKDGGATIASKANLASPTFTGTVTLPTTQLGEASMKLDAALSGAGTWSGITIGGTGGETLVFGDLCYLKAADSKRYKAKADVAATSGPVKLGMCVLAGASTTTEILLLGKIYLGSLTAGSLYFASAATAGAITTTAPTGSSNVVRALGYADSTTEFYFFPSTDYAEV